MVARKGKSHISYLFPHHKPARTLLARDVRISPMPLYGAVTMEKGIDFLKSQVNNAVMQHKTFLEALEDHERQAEDARFRDLCSRHIPRVREHQRMLEEYQAAVGADAGEGKKFLGAMLG